MTGRDAFETPQNRFAAGTLTNVIVGAGFDQPTNDSISEGTLSRSMFPLLQITLIEAPQHLKRGIMTRSFLATVGVMALACQSGGAEANQQGQPGTGTDSEQAAALPEPAEEGSGTIVVTASRTGTPLAKLPTSVSVIDERELSEQLSFSTNIIRHMGCNNGFRAFAMGLESALRR